MPIDCPACGRAVPDPATMACPRCRCDLSGLQRIASAADFHLRAAATALHSGDWELALRNATKSWNLVHTEQSAALGLAITAAMGLWKAHCCWVRAKDHCC